MMLADVQISRLPQCLLGNVFLDSNNEVYLEVHRWDRMAFQGWDTPYTATVTFLPSQDSVDVKIPPSCKLQEDHRIPIKVNEDTIVRQRPLADNRKIPRIVWNLSAPMHKQVSEETKRILLNNRKINKCLHGATHVYKLLEDAECDLEIEKSDDLFPGLKEAYAALRSGSLKADLLRYYLLYKYGGVYMDDKSVVRYSFDSDFFDQVLSGDMSLCVYWNLCPEIAYIASVPKSELLKKVLHSAITNIANRDYSKSLFGITGNILFEKVLKGDGGFEKLAKTAKIRWIQKGNEKISLLSLSNGEKILNDGDIVWQRLIIPLCDQKTPETYYSKLYHSRTLFVDGNPTDGPPMLARHIGILLKCGVVAAVLLVMIIIIVIVKRNPPMQWL